MRMSSSAKIAKVIAVLAITTVIAGWDALAERLSMVCWLTSPGFSPGSRRPAGDAYYGITGIGNNVERVVELGDQIAALRAARRRPAEGARLAHLGAEIEKHSEGSSCCSAVFAMATARYRPGLAYRAALTRVAYQRDPPGDQPEPRPERGCAVLDRIVSLSPEAARLLSSGDGRRDQRGLGTTARSASSEVDRQAGVVAGDYGSARISSALTPATPRTAPRRRTSGQARTLLVECGTCHRRYRSDEGPGAEESPERDGL